MRHVSILIFTFVLFLGQSLNAAAEMKSPWFTGSIYSFGATINPDGVLSLQPYFFFDQTFGSYGDDWSAQTGEQKFSVSSEFYFVYGLGRNLSFEAIPSFSFVNSSGVSSLRVDDSPIFLGMQILRDQKSSMIPDLKVRIRQVLPLGKYDNLDGKKKLTDSSGSGSYKTGLDINLQKKFRISEKQFFRPRLNLGGIFLASPVSLLGPSSYGGDSDTSGYLVPGKSLYAGLSGEYSFCQKFNLGLDIKYSFAFADRFEGKAGAIAGASLSGKESHKILLAPQLEYSFSENIGVVLSAQMVVAGKNTARSAGGGISIAMVF